MAFGSLCQTISMYVFGWDAVFVAQAITLIIINGGAVFSVINYSLASNPPKTGKALFALLVAIFLLIACFALIYQRIGILENGKETKDMVTALYFSVVTWTTLGYGDIQPLGWARLAATIEAMLGYVYLGVFVGLLFKLVIEKSASKEEQKVETHNN